MPVISLLTRNNTTSPFDRWIVSRSMGSRFSRGRERTAKVRGGEGGKACTFDLDHRARYSGTIVGESMTFAYRRIDLSFVVQPHFTSSSSSSSSSRISTWLAPSGLSNRFSEFGRPFLDSVPATFDSLRGWIYLKNFPLGRIAWFYFLFPPLQGSVIGIFPVAQLFTNQSILIAKEYPPHNLLFHL